MIQREARGGAHHGAEQQLAADVAGDGALDQRAGSRRRCVPSPSGISAPHERADLLAVEEHVDRQHEHEHEVEDRAGGFGEQGAAERREFAGALGDFVLDALQRRLALLDEFHVDAVFG